MFEHGMCPFYENGYVWMQRDFLSLYMRAIFVYTLPHIENMFQLLTDLNIAVNGLRESDYLPENT